jgi:hypothetical protein
MTVQHNLLSLTIRSFEKHFLLSALLMQTGILGRLQLVSCKTDTAMADDPAPLRAPLLRNNSMRPLEF